jgi:hypothetical protein
MNQTYSKQPPQEAVVCFTIWPALGSPSSTYHDDEKQFLISKYTWDYSRHQELNHKHLMKTNHHDIFSIILISATRFPFSFSN